MKGRQYGAVVSVLVVPLVATLLGLLADELAATQRPLHYATWTIPREGTAPWGTGEPVAGEIRVEVYNRWIFPSLPPRDLHNLSVYITATPRNGGTLTQSPQPPVGVRGVPGAVELVDTVRVGASWTTMYKCTVARRSETPILAATIEYAADRYPDVRVAGDSTNFIRMSVIWWRRRVLGIVGLVAFVVAWSYAMMLATRENAVRIQPN